MTKRKREDGTSNGPRESHPWELKRLMVEHLNFADGKQLKAWLDSFAVQAPWVEFKTGFEDGRNRTATTFVTAPSVTLEQVLELMEEDRLKYQNPLSNRTRWNEGDHIARLIVRWQEEVVMIPGSRFSGMTRNQLHEDNETNQNLWILLLHFRFFENQRIRRGRPSTINADEFGRKSAKVQTEEDENATPAPSEPQTDLGVGNSSVKNKQTKEVDHEHKEMPKGPDNPTPTKRSSSFPKSPYQAPKPAPKPAPGRQFQAIPEPSTPMMRSGAFGTPYPTPARGLNYQATPGSCVSHQDGQHHTPGQGYMQTPVQTFSYQSTPGASVFHQQQNGQPAVYTQVLPRPASILHSNALNGPWIDQTVPAAADYTPTLLAETNRYRIVFVPMVPLPRPVPELTSLVLLAKDMVFAVDVAPHIPDLNVVLPFEELMRGDGTVYDQEENQEENQKEDQEGEDDEEEEDNSKSNNSEAQEDGNSEMSF